MQEGRGHDPGCDTSALPGCTVVLLMDDEEPILESYSTILGKNGYIVHTAHNGDEALAVFNSHPEIDIAILDLIIHGGMGGIQTAQRMREINPSLRLVAVSGNADDPVLLDPATHGFVAAIPKPYSWQEIISIIKRVSGIYH
jgi:CheY-like chemotaxis protein